MTDPFYMVELDSDNIVLRGIVCQDAGWCAANLGGRWVPTYIDTPGKVYAGQGVEYIPDADNFRPAKPYPSWTFDDAAWQWNAPMPYPADDDGVPQRWDEDVQAWVQMV